jgi:hypothetical protein
MINPCNATSKIELKMLNRICSILFLYKNIDIAGIRAVNEVRAASNDKSMVLSSSSLPERSAYFAILVDSNTDCKTITINK